MLRQLFIGVLWIDDTLRALLQRSFEEGYDIRRVACKLVRQFFVVRDEMRDVDIAIVLFDEDVLSDLVSVDEGTINLKSKDEFFELCLDFCAWFFGAIIVSAEHTDCVFRSCIHGCFAVGGIGGGRSPCTWKINWTLQGKTRPTRSVLAFILACQLGIGRTATPVTMSHA